MIVRPFRALDLTYMEVQPRHRHVAQEIYEVFRGLDQTAYVAVTEWAYTAESDDGEILGCGGIFMGKAWAVLSADLRRHMVAATREVARVLARHNIEQGPVVARIDPEFKEGLRWARLLGFRPIEGTQLWACVDEALL